MTLLRRRPRWRPTVEKLEARRLLAALPMQGFSVPELQAVDDLLQTFFAQHPIFGGALAISHGGEIVYERGFGYRDAAQSDPINETTLMRLASVSKPITAAAIRQLIADGQLTLTTPAFNIEGNGGVLQITPFTGQFGDPRLKDITIEHLLLHKGGWNSSQAGDLTYQDLTIARDMGVPSPPGLMNTARWILSKPLQFAPGTATQYSNVGYQFLGMIVEAVSGMGFETYVRNQIFHPVGIPKWEIEIGRTFAADQNPREPHYPSPPTPVINVFDPLGPAVPLSYGGWHFERRFGQGGLVSSTKALAMLAMERVAAGPQIGNPRSVYPPNQSVSWTHTGSHFAVRTAISHRQSANAEYTYGLVLTPQPYGSEDTDPIEVHQSLDALLASIVTWPQALVYAGDFTGDQWHTSEDVALFMAALTMTAGEFTALYPEARYVAGDFSGDGAVNGDDLSGMIAELDHRGVPGTVTAPLRDLLAAHPRVRAITRGDASPSKAASVQFTVTFTEPVVNVAASDFVLNATGAGGASITGVTGNGSVRIVTVATGSGDGMLTLGLAADATIDDLAGDAVQNMAVIGAVETYAITKSPPMVAGITAHPAVINEAAVGSETFRIEVLFSRPMDAGATPMVTFPTSGKSPAASITFASGHWSNENQVFTAKYHVVDVDETVRGVDVRVSQAQDVAGNVLSAVTLADVFRIDTVIAPPLLVAADDDVAPGIGPAASGGHTNDSAPLIRGTAEPGSAVTVTVGSLSFGPVTADSAGAWAVTTGPLPPGAHIFVATAVDLAGNTSAASQSLALTIDIQPPSPPTISRVTDDRSPSPRVVPAGGRTGDPTLVIAGSAEAASTVTIFANGNAIGTTPSVDGTWSFTTLPLPEGLVTLTARATDRAANQGDASAVHMVTVDLTPPAPPAIVAVLDDVPLHVGPVAAGGVTNDASPTVAGTAEPGVTVTIAVDRVVVGTSLVGDDGQWSLPLVGLADGGRVITATAIDTAGNISRPSASHVIVVDTSVAAPMITTITDDVPLHLGAIRAGGITNDATPTIAGVAEPGTSITVTAGDRVFGPVVTNGSGTWSLIADTLPDGAHAFVAVVVDPSGNTSPASVPIPIVVDTFVAPPRITVARRDVHGGDAVANGGATNALSPTLMGTGVPGDLVSVGSGAVWFGPVAVGVDGSWALQIAASGDGTHRFVARAVDPAGTISAVTEEFAITVDTVSPVITSLTSSSDRVTLGLGASVSLVAAFSEQVRAGATFVAMLSTGRSLPFVVANDGRTATGTFVVQPGESAAPLEVTSLHSAGSAQDAAGNPVTMSVPTIVPEGTPMIDGAIRPLPPPGFTSDATAISVQSTIVSAVQVRLNTPVTGLKSTHFRLSRNGRRVSLRGARLVGTGADYRLILPPRLTRSLGVYSLQIVPESSVRASNGATVSEPTTWYWRQGPTARPLSARVFSGFR